eukprot:scaffold125588_cov32-Tisochrysis_lutea.AAC.3
MIWREIVEAREPAHSALLHCSVVPPRDRVCELRGNDGVAAPPAQHLQAPARREQRPALREPVRRGERARSRAH